MNANDVTHKGKVLVVDDNATNLGVLFDSLKNNGMRVLVAQSGESALELLQDVIPDIILMDVLMPGLDGFETSQRLKANEKTREIPIIFMTALTEMVDKVKGFELGGVDYITKPFQHEEVLARVNTHLTLQNLKKDLLKKNEELATINLGLERAVQEKTHQLIQQEKTAVIGRMIQGIVHNLKSPLSVIQNSNTIIQKKLQQIIDKGSLATPDEETANLIQSIYGDTELTSRAHAQIMNIVNNLMLKSRMDQQQEPTSLNINDLLKQEFDFLEANPQFKHKVKKELQLDENLPSLQLVYSNITQVVENLINNALDAMWNLEDQNLTISTRHDNKNVYIEIKDSGVGIPADKLDSIFDPFYSTKPLKGEEKEGEPTGSGLGLHTCVELLKPFGGRITVKSEIGTGSTFTVQLPIG